MAVKDDLVAKVFLAVDNLPVESKQSHLILNKTIADAVNSFIENRLTLTGTFVGTVPVPSGVAPDPLSGPKVYTIDKGELNDVTLNNCANIISPVGAAGKQWLNTIGAAIKATKFKKVDILQTMNPLSTAPILSLSVYQLVPNEIYHKIEAFTNALKIPAVRQETLEKMKTSIPDKEDDWYNEARILMYGTYDIIFARVITSINTVFTFPSPVMSAMSKSPGSTGAITWIKTVWLDV